MDKPDGSDTLDCFVAALLAMTAEPSLVLLEEQRSSAHAARGGDGGHEGRQGGYDDFDHDFDDVFLFVVHDVG